MELLILLVLILVNGVLVMSEMSLVSARKARLQQWSEEGNSSAGAALALANSPSHFLSTTQIGITVIGILSGAIGEAAVSKDLAEKIAAITWLSPHAEGIAFWTVVVSIAVVSLVLGELVPKRLALLNPEAIASAVARPMQVLSKAAGPLLRLMNVVSEAVLRLLGARASQSSPVTEEEINILMEQGAQAGVFEKHEQALVSRVLRLGDQLIASAMTPRGDIEYFDLNESFDANRQKVLRNAHSRFVVCRGGLDEIVGILRAKSLLDAALEGKPFDFASNARKPLYVPDTLTIIELLEEFKKHRQHLALVVDEFGELQGLVTMNDVMETLVGEVATVEDGSQPDIVRRDDGSWLVDGDIAIERFKEAMGIDREFPDESAGAYRTLGGLSMKLLGRVPKLGDRFTIDDYRFEVIDMDRNRVDKLLVTKVSVAGAAQT